MPLLLRALLMFVPCTEHGASRVCEVLADGSHADLHRQVERRYWHFLSQSVRAQCEERMQSDSARERQIGELTLAFVERLDKEARCDATG